MSSQSTTDFPVRATTDDEGDGMTWSTWSNLLWIPLAGCVAFVCLMFIGRKCKRQRRVARGESVTWSTLSDLDEFRGNFKSLEAIRTYVQQQHWSIKMRLSLFFLICGICLNTYTNFKSFWKFRDQKLIYQGYNIFEEYIVDAAGWLSVVEIVLSLVFTIMLAAACCFGDWVISINVTISFLPNVSGLLYFQFLNTDLILRRVSSVIESKRSNPWKISHMLELLIEIPIAGLFGIFVFYAKILQVLSVYEKPFADLTGSDFLAMVGIARQFATLITLEKHSSNWNFGFFTIHPAKRQALEKLNAKWYRKYDLDEIVCKEAIAEHGLSGWFWLCMVFSSLDNVKRLYLEYDDEIEPDKHPYTQYSVQMNDATQYARLDDGYNL